MLTRLRQCKLSIFLSAALAVSVGCADVTPGDTSSATAGEVSEASSALTISVTTPQGVQDIEQSQTDINQLLSTCSMFLADGKLVSDCGAILDAKDVALAYSDATLRLSIDGGSMRPSNAAYSGQIRQISWSPDYQQVVIHYGSSSSQIDLSKTSDLSLRRQVAGALALQSFTADAGLGVQVEENTGGVCVVIGILAISWLICSTVGTKFCSDAAAKGCGSGNVARYAQICGVGRGVKGDINFGFECQYECKGCAVN